MTASTLTRIVESGGLHGPGVESTVTPERLAVAWQHPTSRFISPVGILTWTGTGFDFQYLAAATTVDGFQPLLGFPDLARRYSSPALFPVFSQRVMRPSRPDYRSYLDALVLDERATGWAVLGRSQGQREGDGVRVLPEPQVDPDGSTSSTFFVHGLRHRLRQDPAVAIALDRLQSGDHLNVEADRDNPVDGRALLLSQGRRVTLGWVPSVLLDYVHTILGQGVPELTVDRVNDLGVPPAYRLLVTLTGTVPPGYRPFDGPRWQIAGEGNDV